ncbi:MAG TPA: hypothetical protein PLH25_03590 [Flavobacterium sp.]|nr:hypothetical protein [Flavobacterium sp.]
MTKDKNKKNVPWEITANRFVGIMDIMGFKDLVARNNHETVYEMMKKVSNAMKVNQSVFSVDYDSDNFDINIIMMTYSDSIMIYSRDDSQSSQENFIASISALSEDLFKDGIPHKGGVAFGKMTLDFENSIFFGQPLIDAYLLQEELNLYGIVAHPTAEFKNEFYDDETVIEYNCPFKTGNAKHYTILPSTFFTDPFDIKEFEILHKSVSALRVNTSGGLRKYIDNTLSYLTYSKDIYLKKIEDFEKEMEEDNPR